MVNRSAYRMPYSGMWHHVGLVRIDVLEEHVTTIFRVERNTWAKKSVTSWLTDWTTVRKNTNYIELRGVWAGGNEWGRGVDMVVIKARHAKQLKWRRVWGMVLKDQALCSHRHDSLVVGASDCVWLHSKLDRVSCYGDFLREQMRGFHDLLGQKPTSLFILSGWSSIWMASLTMLSMCRVLVTRMEILWNWIQCPKLTTASAV
jgi:hypothetical protein